MTPFSNHEKFPGLLGVSDVPPVDDSPLHEDSDFDLHRLNGVRGDADGDGGVVPIDDVEGTQVH